MANLFKIPYRTRNRQVDMNFAAVQTKLRSIEESLVTCSTSYPPANTWSVAPGADNPELLKLADGYVEVSGAVYNPTFQSDVGHLGMQTTYEMKDTDGKFLNLPEEFVPVQTQYLVAYGNFDGYAYNPNIAGYSIVANVMSAAVVMVSSSGYLSLYEILGDYTRIKKPTVVNYLNLDGIRYKTD